MMTRLEEIKERYPTLERRLASLTREGFVTSMFKDIDWLLARVEKLEEALRFYADERHYETTEERIETGYVSYWMETSAIRNDVGKLAREALSDG